MCGAAYGTRRSLAAAAAYGLCSAVAVASLVVQAAAQVPRAHEILATGDVVEGLGHIGWASFEVYGIDDAGRLLVGGQLDRGGELLVWRGETDTTVVWFTPPGADPQLIGARFLVAPGNRILVSNFGGVPISELRPDGFHPLVRSDHPGFEEDLCWITQMAVNDVGEVAFQAEFGSGGDCRFSDRPFSKRTVFVTAGDRVRPAIHLSPHNNERLIGMAADGTLVLMMGYDRIDALREGTLRTLVAEGDRGPGGGVLRSIEGLAVNARGDVLFVAHEDGAQGVVRGVYRTENGRLLRVDRGPDDIVGVVTFSGDAILDAAGNVAISATWNEEMPGRGNQWFTGVVVFDPGGHGRFAARHASLRGMNAAGEVGLHSHANGRVSAARWRDGTVQVLLTADDELPGGGRFLFGGPDIPFCLAADGRVVAWVPGTSGRGGLACGDRDGFHFLAAHGDPAAEGGMFGSFYQCAVPVGEAVLFGAERIDPATYRLEKSVYRAAPPGITRIAGPGQVTERGAVVGDLLPITEAPGGDLFASNAHGTTVMRANTDQGEAVLRRRPGGGLEHVELDVDPSSSIGDVVHFGGVSIADDATVVATVAVRAEPDAITRWVLIDSDGSAARVRLDAAEDPRLPEGRLRFGAPLARGDRVVFTAVDGAERWYVLEYRLGDGNLRVVLVSDPTTPHAPPWLLRDLTAAGRLLFFSLASGAYHVLDADGSELVIRADPSGDFRVPIAVNDRDNLLLWQDQWFGQHRGLELSGPLVESADCFIPPTSVPQALPTPTPTPIPPSCEGPEANPHCLRLAVSSTAGEPGDRISVSVRLEAAGEAVAGTQNDLSVADVADIVTTADGRPSCRVNPDIRKDVATSIVGSSQTGGTTLRALVLALDNVDPIPNAPFLYECDLRIAADARPGRYPLVLSNVGASDPDGNALSVAAANGILEVLSSTDVPLNENGASVGGGCAIEPMAVRDGWPALLLAALIWFRRRARHPLVTRAGTGDLCP